MEEQRTHNPLVLGSTPSSRTNFFIFVLELSARSPNKAAVSPGIPSGDNSNLEPEIDMSEIKQGNLARKLALVLREVGKVPKSGHNAFHKYDYVTENDLVYAVRDKLSAAGIFVFTSIESQEIEVFQDEQSKKQSVLTKVQTRHTFVDGETGEQFSVLSQGQGADTGDKGGYKAATGAMKYFLYKCFMIPTGDDPEADPKTDERGAAGIGSRTTSSKSTQTKTTMPAGAEVPWRDYALHFGKNKGRFLGDLADNDPDALVWYIQNWFPRDASNQIDAAMRNALNRAGVELKVPAK